MTDEELDNILYERARTISDLGVYGLLTTGRKDPSGDVTKGANLTPTQALKILEILYYGTSIGRKITQFLQKQKDD